MNLASKTMRRCAAALLAAAAAWSSLPSAAQTPPAQQPLISRDGGSVKPNVVLTLDTSGSMIHQYLPSGSFRVGAYTVTFSNDLGSALMHPLDSRIYVPNFRGTVPADPANTTNVFQRQMRSPDVNAMYYNPETLYRPWVLSTGVRMANANPAAVLVDGTPGNNYWVAGAPATVNLTAAAGTATVPGMTVTVAGLQTQLGLAWCDAIDAASVAPPGSVAGGHGLQCTAGSRIYAPGLYYRLLRNGSGNFLDPNIASNYTLFDINNPPGAGFPRGEGRTDCAGATCSQAEERQNFANWFQYHRSRLSMVQGAIPEAFVSQPDTIRLGWGDLYKSAADAPVDGQPTPVVVQGVRNYTDPHKLDFFNFLRGHGVGGFTPLRQVMYGVGLYYSRADNGGPWSDDPATMSTAEHKSCRRSYHIMVTDGYWNDANAPLALPGAGAGFVGNSDNTAGALMNGPNGQSYQYSAIPPYRDDRYNQDGGGDGRGTLADVAMHFWKRDLRPDLADKVPANIENPAFWQHMVNFTVGLGVRGTLDPLLDQPALTAGSKVWGSDRIDDLWHAALNSRGKYFNAKTPDEMASAMRSALEKTAERELKESGVATAVATLQDDNRKYVPRYRSGAWVGDVEAFTLNISGEASALPVWSAQARLPVWNQRRIVTWDPGQTTPQGVSFTWASMSIGNRTALGAGQPVLDYLRGDRSGEGPSGLRQRQQLLADFVNTTPVFAKRAFDAEHALLPGIGPSYLAYWNGIKTSRDGVLYIGGNGGMLHGFRDSNGVQPTTDGTEVFAYVPRAVYPTLPNLASRTYGSVSNYHTYYVDGPLREADVYLPAPTGGAAQWRNYLLGSTGAGARAVFALDVTDPNALGASSIRWEFSSTSDADLGHVLFPLASGVLPNGQWVALFGNGYGSSAQNAFLYVVNAATGAVLQKLAVGTPGSNGLGGVTVVRNSQGQLETLYAGDLRGSLWKFSVNGAGSGFLVANSGNALFIARDALGAEQAVVQPPALFNHTAGGRIVVFGTGRLITLADATSTSIQTLYGVRDNPPESLALPLNRSNLAPRTLAAVQGTGAASQQTFFSLGGTAVDWTMQRGWLLDLNTPGYAGLRMLYPPQAPTSRFAYISTVSPAQNPVVCDETFGRAIDFILPVETALNPAQNVIDTNGDGLINASDAPVAAFATRADGAKTLISGGSVPGANGSAPCHKFVSLNTVDKTDLCLPSNPIQGIRDRTWRRLVNPPLR